MFLTFLELTDENHLPVHIFNCTDKHVDFLVTANPPALAILWVLCWGQLVPNLPAGFSYQRTVVVSAHCDSPVVLLWAASNAHTSDTLNVCLYFTSSYSLLAGLFHWLLYPCTRTSVGRQVGTLLWYVFLIQ